MLLGTRNGQEKNPKNDAKIFAGKKWKQTI